MSDAKPVRIPKYRLHKPTGLGLVRARGRDFYLGKHGTPESRQAYDCLIAEWRSGTPSLPPKPPDNTSAQGEASVNELFLA